jgi:cytochrome c
MIIPLIGVLVGSLLFAAAQKTVMDGVYTSAQADRGKASYSLYCADCHSEDLSGGADSGGRAVPLKADRLVARKDLNNLFRYIRDWMPADDRGSLNDKTCIDIVAYILQRNGYPGGSEELKPDGETLKQIALVKQ